MRQAKRLCKELMVCLLVWTVPVMIIMTIVARRHLAMFAGVAVGSLTAAGLIWHMYYHLDIALDMDPKHAQRHTQIAAIKRMAIMAVVMGVSMVLWQYIHPVGTVLGIFGMKIAAFLYPALHKKIKRVKL